MYESYQPTPNMECIA